MRSIMLLLQFLTILFTNSFIKMPFQKKHCNLCEYKAIFKLLQNNTLFNKKNIHMDILSDVTANDEKWEDGEIPWEFNDTQQSKNDTNKNPILNGHNIAFLFI